MKHFLPLLMLTGLLFGQDTVETSAKKNLSKMETQEDNERLIEIETKDGNIFLGTLLEETEDNYKIITNDGIEINVPKSLVKKFEAIETTEVGGEVWRADPNKSMYLFAPSAFPIENNKSYCRDFCLFFPSYNRGFGNSFSLQFGAFIFPGMDISSLPIIISGKYSLPKTGSAGLAAGIMYVSLPGEDISFGTGIVFGTATLGNRFTHFSASLGWGYFRDEDEWEFADEPMLVLAGNLRASNSIAIVVEYWKFPNIDIEDLPLMVSTRFIGRKFAVDVGTFLHKDMEGIPFPLINFTYHM